MEFLDPKKQRAYFIRLIIGYILVGTALILTVIIFLYQAYGFSIKDGQVIQNGLVFVSSQPNPASIYINGQLSSNTTDTRLLMPAGQYTFELVRPGYRTWQRAISVEGGAVEHFDYPFLFPTKLVTKVTENYTTAPLLATQSLDRRWLLIQDDALNYGTFELRDLSNPTTSPTTLTVPQSLFTLTTGTSSWQFVEWANDNQHVLLKHVTNTNGTIASEYILLDTNNIADSVNLTKTLGVNPTEIQLANEQYNNYFLYFQDNQTLDTASLSNPAPTLLLSNVLGFDTYSTKMILYATNQGEPSGQVAVKLLDGTQTYDLCDVPTASSYILDLTQYSGNWYMVAGSSSSNRTYIYENPVSSLQSEPSYPLVPVQILKVSDPNYVQFSANASLVMVENGSQIGVYNAETTKAYAYNLKYPLDAPQPNVMWMDGDRLVYVSNNKIVVLDYDNTNQQVLEAADPAYGLFFDTNYKYLYNLNETTTQSNSTKITDYPLDSTGLLTPQDE